MANIRKVEQTYSLSNNTPEYVQLVSQISNLWDEARAKVITTVNTNLLQASWQTGEYIVQYEQKGNLKAEYGKSLLVDLAKDLTLRLGKGYSKSNLFSMRAFYIHFPKFQTVSGKLSWSHYLELIKCDDPMEMQFYMTQAIQENWSVRGLKRQIDSSLFQRLALSTDKEGVLALGLILQTKQAVLHRLFQRDGVGDALRQRLVNAEGCQDAVGGKVVAFNDSL